MTIPMIWVVTFIYTCTAISLLCERKLGLALTFLAYALANVGLILELSR